MKNKKTPTFILVVILLFAIPFSLASCMEKEDYYTKEDISSLVSTLENKIAQNKSDYEAALEELTAEYETKQAMLDAEDKANADAIAKVEEDYKAAVAELEATYSEKIATIETLITALSETSEDNVKRIAKLEAQVEALLSRHEHTYGEWIDYRGNSAVYCEERLFYRICTECNVLEWKSGTYDNHSFSTVTTPPTCVSEGYDTKTCGICGKIEIINKTPISDHIWKNDFSYDNSFHWIDCNYCDAEKEKAEHTTDESGYCTVCDKPVGATEGIIYEISSDGTYASAVGYDGTAVRVKIADMYEGVPVTELCDGVFQEKNIVSVIIPDSVTSIGSSVFYNCDSLTSVVIPDSVTTIGDRAFSNCDSLTSVTILDSVTSIGDQAFYQCQSLTSVTIGNSLTSVGRQAFSYCNSALYTEYNYGKYVGDSENPYSVLIELTNKNFTTYDINEETKIIAADVFKGCARLNSIVIPDSVTSIGDYAFSNCDSLTSVVIPDSVTSIGSDAFSYCDSLTSVTIPDSVTTIGSSAFSYCDSLTSVHISDIAAWCNILFGNSYSTPLRYAKNLYVGGTLVEDFVILEGVTSIGDYAFAFYDSLTSVVIPDSVTSIGNYAFYYCDSLTSVLIPNSVTSIGSNAFSYCDSLTDVYYSGSKEEWKIIVANDAFDCAPYITIHFDYVKE